MHKAALWYFRLAFHGKDEGTVKLDFNVVFAKCEKHGPFFK